MDICRDNYIVRVYRRNKDNLYNIVGIIEDVEREANKAFHNVEELVGIITGEGKKDVKEMRRVNRLRLMLPVKVSGVNTIGKRFSEDATIKDISSYGAYINMKNQVSKDTGVSLVIDPEDSCLNMKARVVRIENGRNKTGVGVAFI